MSFASKFKNIYQNIPNWGIQAFSLVHACMPNKYYFGTTFCNTTEYIEKYENATKKEIEQLEDELFRKTLIHAYEHVPYYKKAYAGIDVYKITLADIERLPCIDKEEIRQHQEDFIADDVDKEKMIYITTSGTSGKPIGVYQPDSIIMKEWAYTLNIWKRVGYTPKSMRLVLRGKKIRDNKFDSDYFYDPFKRELSINIFDMSDDNLEKYCLAIEKYRPEFMHGYMSAITILTKYIEGRGGINNRFKAILATSENIYETQKRYVEKVLNARVFSFYGHSERLVIAGEDENSSDYYIEPTYGYCEICDQNGHAANKGEIIATGFLNQVMPLIRYRTGDIAEWSVDSSEEHKRHYKRIKCVAGRWNQDYLVDKSGNRIFTTALNIHTDDFDKIKQYRFVQYEKGIVEIHIVPIATLSKDDQETIISALNNRTRQQIDYKIVLEEKMDLGENGKFSYVEQYVKE